MLVGVGVVEIGRRAEVKGEFLNAFLGEIGEAEDFGVFTMEVGVPLGGGNAAARLESEVRLVEKKVEASEVDSLTTGRNELRAGDGDGFVAPAIVDLEIERPERRTQKKKCG